MICDISDLFFAHPNYSVFHSWLVYAISSGKMLWIHWFDLVLVWLWIQLLLRNEVTLKTSLSSWHAFMGFWEYIMDHGIYHMVHHGTSTWNIHMDRPHWPFTLWSAFCGGINFELGFCERNLIRIIMRNDCLMVAWLSVRNQIDLWNWICIQLILYFDDPMMSRVKHFKNFWRQNS